MDVVSRVLGSPPGCVADHWYPRTGSTGLPTALIRVPYGRTRATASQMARPPAERGFQVLVPSTRGTFGSGDTFDPLSMASCRSLRTLSVSG
ncbi:CocE/NonD family hydrolase [Streptomyces sp. NPDC001100]